MHITSIDFRRFMLMQSASASARVTAIIFTLMFSTPAMFAADDEATKAPSKAPYNVVYFDFGFGGFSPSSSLASAPTRDCSNSLPGVHSPGCAEAFSGTPSIDVGLGVRPRRYVQGGLGFNYVGNYAGFPPQSLDYQCVTGCTGGGTRKVGTTSLVYTADARLVLPFFREHLTVSAGAGIGWLEINQKPQAVGNEQIQGCSICQSRRAHGPTEIAEVIYFPAEFIGIGFHYRSLQVSSSGLTPDTGPGVSSGITYKDRFSLIGGGVTIRLGTRHH